MQTVIKKEAGKNDLWTAYKGAESLLRDEIILELKKAGLLRYWQDAASKEGYNLKMAKPPLRDIFLKHMPETAYLFGVKKRPSKQDRQPSPAPLFDETAPQPQN